MHQLPLSANESDNIEACLAAAKTILNEMKQDFPEEAPLLWTVQAFSVAAAVSVMFLFYLCFSKSAF